MPEIITSKGNFLFIHVPKFSAIFYLNMGYLAFKQLFYKNPSGALISDPPSMAEKYDDLKWQPEWRQSGIKLPNKKYEFICVLTSALLDSHPESQNFTKEKESLIIGLDEYENIKRANGLFNNDEYPFDLLMGFLYSKYSEIELGTNYAILKMVK